MFQHDGNHDIYAGAKFKEHLSSMSVQELKAELDAIFEKEERVGIKADPELIVEYLAAIDRMESDKYLQTQTYGDFEETWVHFTRSHPNLFLTAKIKNKTSTGNRHSTAWLCLNRLGRSVATAAAAVALVFVMMIGAQAAGVDVFGTLARWTDSTFHHVTAPRDRDETISLENTSHGSIDVQRVLGEYAPTWLPDGATATASSVREDEFGVAIQVSFSLPDDRNFFIQLDQYPEREDIDSKTFEIDTDFREKYPSNSRLYYIFSNEDYFMATWSDGTTMQSILGELSVEELKSIIDSIGG